MASSITDTCLRGFRFVEWAGNGKQTVHVNMCDFLVYLMQAQQYGFERWEDIPSDD